MSDDRDDAVRVRTATAEDRDALGRLWTELMDFHARLDPAAFTVKEGALPVWFEWLDKCMAAEGHVVLVADAGGEAVGYAMLGVSERPPVFEDRRYGSVHEACVRAEWRRRGVGRRLFETAVQWFREQGVSEMQLGAAARNPVSNAFWRELGFRPHVMLMRRAVDIAEA